MSQCTGYYSTIEHDKERKNKIVRVLGLRLSLIMGVISQSVLEVVINLLVPVQNSLYTQLSK